MQQTRFDLLTKRHRECLRRVRQLKGSKEIAAELSLTKSTVDSYVTESVRLLGARNRRDAAMMLDEYERSLGFSLDTQPDPAPVAPAETDPDKVIPDSARLSDPDPDLPPTVLPTGGADGGTGQGVKLGLSRMPLPLRRRGQTMNDLRMSERLLYIPTIAVALAIGFGMLASGLEVLTGVAETASRLFR